MAYSIYGLVDPRSGLVMYVGMAYDPHKRYRRHMSMRSACLAPWLVDLQRLGLKPDLQILQECRTLRGAQSAEIRWIWKYRKVIVNKRKHTNPKLRPRPLQTKPKPPTVQDWHRYCRERGLEPERICVPGSSVFAKRQSDDISAVSYVG